MGSALRLPDVGYYAGDDGTTLDEAGEMIEFRLLGNRFRHPPCPLKQFGHT